MDVHNDFVDFFYPAFEKQGDIIESVILGRCMLRGLVLLADETSGTQHIFPDQIALEALRIAQAVICNHRPEGENTSWGIEWSDEETYFSALYKGVEFQITFHETGNRFEIFRQKTPYGEFYSSYADSTGAFEISPVDLDDGNVMRDSVRLTTDDVPAEVIRSMPLWKHPNSIQIDDAVKTLQQYFTSNGTVWSFWRDWYQGFLDGKPLDWELQRRVALIPDQDWEKGPEHIARKIEEIRARFELEKRLEELEAEKQVWQERARLGIGGNNPPEAIEDARIVQEIIWAPIEELKAETQSEAPDKSRIKSAISKLKALAAGAGIWAFAKADAALEQALNDYLPKFLEKHGDKLGDLIKAAQDWLGTLL
ncbi:hypothetical protein [Aliiroseovarius crassostreae]|uniref:hypothetical protein n=1 Tax=Aliiroseovarius crassostreae TaxID=154981 RepID=UPI00220AE894|nr:hypothetical protein [Aliiroseovarius crassostreae]UWP97923.1 hypothetical protein K3X53_11150 [Aliiroseovarius crassostreae]